MFASHNVRRKIWPYALHRGLAASNLRLGDRPDRAGADHLDGRPSPISHHVRSGTVFGGCHQHPGGDVAPAPARLPPRALGCYRGRARPPLVQVRVHERSYYPALTTTLTDRPNDTCLPSSVGDNQRRSPSGHGCGVVCRGGFGHSMVQARERRAVITSVLNPWSSRDSTIE